jgi:hypothetical protein
MVNFAQFIARYIALSKTWIALGELMIMVALNPTYVFQKIKILGKMVLPVQLFALSIVQTANIIAMAVKIGIIVSKKVPAKLLQKEPTAKNVLMCAQYLVDLMNCYALA